MNNEGSFQDKSEGETWWATRAVVQESEGWFQEESEFQTPESTIKRLNKFQDTAKAHNILWLKRKKRGN